MENQAKDHVYRIGQKKPVTVYYPTVTDSLRKLASGMVEEIIHQILEEKNIWPAG